MRLIKPLGAVFLILSCGMTGMKYANRLKIRVKSLKSFLISMDSITVYIRLSDFHIEEVLNKCLPEGMEYGEKGLKTDASLCLTNGDKQLIDEFLKDLGMTDASCLINKCKGYRELINASVKEAEKDILERYRLLMSSGFLIGITLSFLWW